MYTPGFYREEREDLIRDLIRDYPFAVLVTLGGEHVSHLPLILEDKGESRCLLGHMARANPHWRELSGRAVCKVIHQGPHGYISPAWYAPQEDNVPTWNYAVVHATGKFEIVSDETEVFEAMDRLVTTFETKYQTGWQLPRGEKAIVELMKGIVIFRIRELHFEAKFKLSQKIESSDRENVIAQLKRASDQTLTDLASRMERVLTPAQ